MELQIGTKPKLIRSTIYLSPSNKTKIKLAAVKVFQKTHKHCSEANLLNILIERYIEVLLDELGAK